MSMQAKLSLLLFVVAMCGCGSVVHRPGEGGAPAKMTRHEAETTLRHSVVGHSAAQMFGQITKVTDRGFWVSYHPNYSFEPDECEFAAMDDLHVRDFGEHGYHVVPEGVYRDADCTTFTFKDRENAIRMAEAIYVLKNKLYTDAGDPRSEQERFAETARQYRSANPKPTLPEAARRHKVQAEDAIAGKRLGDAVRAYDSALHVAPWWPDGHFNNAIILSELQLYEDAIAAMKRYLELVPTAPDARAAQDRIYQWEALAAKE